jgi:3-dehydroquinate dehydratase/shikimate dehydrogenase
MLQICVSLTEASIEGVIRGMARLAGRADLIEVRADLLEDMDLLAILRAKTEPLLFTCRSPAEGGGWGGGETQRRRVLLEAVKRGFDYVDVELAAGFTEVIAEKAGRGLVLSHHDLSGTPENLADIYDRMRGLGADVAKIVTTPHSIADVGRLLEFAAHTSKGDGPPLVPIAMGPLGLITRLVAGRYGSPFTYASAAAGAEAAPGQLPVDLMADVYRVRQVSAATKVYGVLGTHVVTSLSPLLHNTAFEAAGVDAIYVPLQAETLDAFLAALPALGLSGFSVTRPYKEQILPHLQKVDHPAMACGSVNTVNVEAGELYGSTTDGPGLVTSLSKHIDVAGKRVVVIGAGGAARAAAQALLGQGAHVTLLARRRQSAEIAAGVLDCAFGDLAEIADHPWDILINATPVGSGHLAHESPVPAILHQPGTVVLDMVYDPLETILLQDARAVAATTIGGLEMLIAQAAPQFELWTGQPVPTEAMESAAAELVGG